MPLAKTRKGVGNCKKFFAKSACPLERSIAKIIFKIFKNEHSSIARAASEAKGLGKASILDLPDFLKNLKVYTTSVETKLKIAKSVILLNFFYTAPA